MTKRIATNHPQDEAKVERILTALPESQRRVIERYFGFATEASIEVEIQRAADRNLFKSVAEYEAALEGAAQSARFLAISEILGIKRQAGKDLRVF